MNILQLPVYASLIHELWHLDGLALDFNGYILLNNRPVIHLPVARSHSHAHTHHANRSLPVVRSRVHAHTHHENRSLPVACLHSHEHQTHHYITSPVCVLTEAVPVATEM